MNRPAILFCEDPLQPKKVEPDFESEYDAALRSDFEIFLVNYEELVNNKDAAAAIKRINGSDQLKEVIYRGWMLSPEQYTRLYEALLIKNLRLLNSPKEYRNCHYLPDSLWFIKNRTPQTIFEKYKGPESIDQIINQAQVFGTNPVIIKDYVKSEKHDWDTACFVKDASDKHKMRQTLSKFIALRGKFLNEGIVIRKFIELKNLTLHSKSKMPLTEEYRLFFFRKKLVGIYNYWEEGEYAAMKPDTSEFEDLALQIESHFFSMDIARKRTGEMLIIELGDGQVSGLPDALDKTVFYHNLKVLSNADLSSIA